MPGTRLNDTERNLKSVWDRERFGRFPLLKSISITAPVGSGLRGIRELKVDFAYPVTFMSGQNGCGKSTLLSLAALGFHGHAGHVPTNARRFSGQGEAEFGYYTFQDFFHRGPGDADVSGVRLEWKFSGDESIAITKRSDKWMHYERRPVRPVEFFGLSRAVPAIELPALRNQFGFSATPTTVALSAAARTHLEHVLSRAYPSAEVLSGRRTSIRRSGRAGGYTSFNMGTGEDALIGLLARLHAVPEGSLVVIEELETGLHPAAQQRAAQALIQIAWDRKLQIIGSTHSHHVLDQLPRQARVLVVREAASHRIIASPSSQFALSEMSDSNQCELVVLCEDEFAASLIAQMLPKAMRRRVSIKSCGSKSELALQAQSHLRLVEQAKCIILWDGDVTEQEALGYVQTSRTRYPHATAERRLSWAKLPGTDCPELWAFAVAQNAGIAEICTHFGFESDDDARGALQRCGLGDPHAIAFELSRQVGLQEPAVAAGLAICAARAAVVERNAIVAVVQAALDGQVLASGRLVAGDIAH